MPATRTDAHSPTNLVTEDYEYLYSWDSQQPGCLVGIAQSDAWKEWHSAGPVLPDVSSSQCTHCGAHLRYVALLRYIPTGQYLYVGETCLDNRFSIATADFQRLRKAAQLDREAQRIRTSWVAFQLSNEIAWNDLFASSNTFVQDVLRRGRQYGNLSERQLAAIVKVLGQDAERAAKAAADPEIKVAVPEGKFQITGEIVSIKEHHSDFGTTDKLTVKVTTPDGVYLVWGTEPGSLYGTWDGNNEWVPGVGVGDTINFSATVTRSDRDDSFGFYSRPTKARIVARKGA